MTGRPPHLSNSLFGLSAERIRHLMPGRLDFAHEHVHPVLGRHRVLPPPRLAELPRQLAERPQP
ncbi:MULTISPECIES: hypothetical protein [Streptomyces]|uniref:Uncharacterized protein n=1 Tax=Streptomyces eurythermus TaxID=42237 RepID=A0ABW6YV41_9ACTN|nr:MULTISPECIES: hypothetical protein [Streptomyces]QIS68860.1 hypothetical protein HB370_01635 [Streptomyces sp. DSM 40868]